MRADLPKDLKELIEQSPDWSGFVIDSYGVVENQRLIVAEAPHFFPEYTEHGCRHVIDVLATAWALVPKDCRDDGFTAADGGGLALSVLLHDLAMHLSEHGVLSLISENSRWKPLPGWKKDRPWAELWDSFLAEARRFDAAKRRNLFGDADWQFREPPLGNGDMSKNDRLLVGEFLRQHHPRLAHEIALYGFPAADGKAIEILPAKMEPTDRNIIGLTARSHGLDLRDAMRHLEEDDQFREWNGLHPVYLMALLRVGDYLRVQSDRAPAGRLLLEPLLSPVSQKEQDAHQAVKAVRPTGAADPECLTITAKPPNVRVHTKITTWLRGIQGELDRSWAVLGEVYGRYPDVLAHPELSIRRVKSNLDDAEDFDKKVPYVPQPITFTTAGGPLLKLLVGPLYGEEPRYGMRELMQNAVDAVRERYDLCDKHPHLLPRPPAKGHGDDVVISIDVDEDGTPVSVTCRDIGIGMSLETIRDYFLKAGASLRSNPHWRKHHADDDNQVNIPRTGRFGIGVLAAFLIGNRITVTSRHQESEIGYRFETALDEELIEIRKVEGLEVGTTIVVRDLLNAGELTDLMTDEDDDDEESFWNWYRSSWPNVRRLAGLTPLSPPVPRNDPVRWSLSLPHYQHIHIIPDKARRIICNDFIVGSGYRIHDQLAPISPYPFVLDVDDPNGLLPLSLQRTQLTERPDFAPDLSRIMIKDSIARLLADSIRGRLFFNSGDKYAICKTTQGWTPCDLGWLKQLGVTRLLIRGFPGYESRQDWEEFGDIPLNYAATINGLSDKHPDTPDFLPRLHTRAVGHGFVVNHQNRWLRGDHPPCLYFVSRLNKRGYLTSHIVASDQTPDLDLVDRIKAFSTPGILCEFHFAELHYAPPHWLPTWLDLVPGGILPFDRAEAERLLAPLFEDPQFVAALQYYDLKAADLSEDEE